MCGCYQNDGPFFLSRSVCEENLDKVLIYTKTNRLFALDFYLNYRVFLSRNYRLIVAPRKFDVLKTNIWKFDVLKNSIFALEASLLGQIFVLRTSNFQGATIRSIVPRHKHSIVFIVHH